ncbi:MAG TPA: hypothetical protein VJ729_02875 [Nitrososphaeraceae archaeon]|nr:hypothetical protein [Nitrososphaeraceae archaeon]
MIIKKLSLFIRRRQFFSIIALLVVTEIIFVSSIFSSPPALLPMLIPKSYAHFDHQAHYNAGGIGLGNYYVNEQIEPEYTPPRQPAKISFSIQDTQGNDVYNVVTMVEVYSEMSGERISVYPWTRHNIGDFDVYYVFPKIGSYQIVLSIGAENTKDVKSYEIGPPRTVLSSNLNCDCYRAVFSASVSQNFGNIFISAVFAGIIAAIIVFGLILVFSYRSRRMETQRGTSAIISDSDSTNTNNSGSSTGLYPKLTKNEVIKYSVLLLAISSGIVHLAVFSEHSSLRIQYSIFLLAAAASQIAYGILYVLITIGGEAVMAVEGQNREYAKSYYRKSITVNLFGLIGSLILLGLYTYSVTFPPPLSPNNMPDKIDFGGILDKSLELALVIGIIYLMKSEKKMNFERTNNIT